MLKIFKAIGLTLLLLGTGAVGAEIPVDSSTVTPILNPPEIDIGMFFNGADIAVSADLPQCDGAALVLEAGRSEITLNRKGRVAGIWLNVAQIEVNDVPKVYVLATSDKLAKICAPEELKKLPLGVDYLRRKIEFTSEEPLTGSEFDDFLKLQKENGSIKLDVGIDLTPDGHGGSKLSATLPVAQTISPGTYKVLLYGFKDGNVISRGSAEISVKRVGLARLLANLATNHAAGYGAIAIIVAMMVGIVMGVIFDSLPGSGH